MLRISSSVALMLSYHTALLAQVAGRSPTETPAAIATFRSGQQAFAEGRFDLAVDHFENAIAASPRFAAAHCALGQTRMAQRRYTDAIGSLEECKSLSQSLALRRSAEEATLERERRQEIQEVQRHIEGIRSGEIKTGGEMMVTKLESRLQQLEQGRQRTPTNVSGVPPGIPFALGTAYLRAGRYEAAQRELSQAVDAKPNFGEAHNNLAAVAVAMARWQDAAQHIELAEKAGFRVSEALKADVADRRASIPAPADTSAPQPSKPSTDSIRIEHSAIVCVPPKTFPRLEARIEPPDSVAEANAFFRSDADEGWYAVRLRPDGERFVAVLPRPRSIESFRYYLEVTSGSSQVTRTPEHVTTVARHLRECADSSSVAMSSASGLIVQAPAGIKRSVPRGFSSQGTSGDIGQFEMSLGVTLAAAALVGGGAATVALSQAGKEAPGFPPVGEPFVTGPGIAFDGSMPPPGSTLSRSSGSLAVQLRIFSPEALAGAMITAAFFNDINSNPCLLLRTRQDVEASRIASVVVSGPTRLEIGCSARLTLTRLSVSVAGADQRTAFETGQPGIPHIPITFGWGE